MMIRALLRKQLRELGAAFLRSSKTGKARSRASAVGYALLFAVLVVVLMLCFAGMALPLASVLLPAGLDWLYFASMGLTALLVSVLASVSAAARGENITVIFVNNAIYGMTGGQMAPTSLPGQITQTSPYGRDVNTCGWPIRICEMLATLEAPAYLERVTVNNVKNVKNAKKAIEKAFRYQVEGKGFSLIEVLSACPTNWGLTPQKALEWIDEKMIPYYPLGVYRDKEG